MSTELALFLVQFAMALGCLVMAIAAFQAADAARRSRVAVDNERLAWQKLARECQTATLRADALEESLDSLKRQHQRLHGKFHATLRKPDEPAEPESPEEIRQRLRAAHGLPKVNGGE